MLDGVFEAAIFGPCPSLFNCLPMFDLTGHTAFITGSTQGVGRALAVALARAGANIILHGLNIDENAEHSLEMCRQHNVQAHLIDGDFLDGSVDSTVAAVATKAESLGLKIDLLVNNAGSYFDVPFLDMGFETFDKTMRLNVYSYFFMTQWFARRWVAGKVAGRVLMVGSINGRLAERTHAAYDTSKGAVEMMVKTLCVELAPHGIRVNGIAPGLFHTPLTGPALANPTAMAWMQLHTPNGEVPDADVAGEAAVYLLSDAARHVHGQMLMIDGGMSVWQQPPGPNG